MEDFMSYARTSASATDSETEEKADQAECPKVNCNNRAEEAGEW